jgi:hypothetical protein
MLTLRNVQADNIKLAFRPADVATWRRGKGNIKTHREILSKSGKSGYFEFDQY